MPVPKGTKFTEEHKRNIAATKMGELNPNWKGDKASKQSGRERAIRKYPFEPCTVCGSLKSERHHKDGNTLNNERSNIQFLCRKHHMQIDGRKTGVDLGGRHLGEDQATSKLTEQEVLEIRAEINIGPYAMARKYNVSYRTIWAARTGKTWKHLPMPN